ncbi:hypothetical protein BKA69DRAFT_185859 [Paraphysoderma sedebokerense]|nr:hypothetical protein BKA69DRAFT_185859 [Paraphysoderma sedebokerense]
MKASLVIPLALFSLVVIFLKSWRLVASITRRTSRGTAKINDDVSDTVLCVKVFNVLLSIVFITVVESALALFDCTQEEDGRYYLDADPSLQCYQKWYYEDVPIATLAVILYVIGIPLYFFGLLYSTYQARFHSRVWVKLKTFSQKVLLSDKLYRAEHQYFVFVQFLQKLAFVVINMFFTRYVILQSTLMIFVLAAVFLIYAFKKLYTNNSLNRLELSSIATTFIVLNLGQTFRADYLRTAEQRLAFAIFILVLVLGYLVVVFFYGVYEFLQVVRNSRFTHRLFSSSSNTRPAKPGIRRNTVLDKSVM